MASWQETYKRHFKEYELFVELNHEVTVPVKRYVPPSGVYDRLNKVMDKLDSLPDDWFED